MKSPLKVVSREEIYKGRIIRLIRERIEVDGVTLVRETVEHPGAVVVVPLLPGGRVVMVRQYRRAIGRYLLELPAGTRDKKESPASCARRELTEETGWRARRMSPLGSFYSAPGFTSERMLLYLAEGLQASTANPEPDELVTPVILPFGQALAKVYDGSIRDGKTIIGLLLARERLRRGGPALPGHRRRTA